MIRGVHTISSSRETLLNIRKNDLIKCPHKIKCGVSIVEVLVVTHNFEHSFISVYSKYTQIKYHLRHLGVGYAEFDLNASFKPLRV